MTRTDNKITLANIEFSMDAMGFVHYKVSDKER